MMMFMYEIYIYVFFWVGPVGIEIYGKVADKSFTYLDILYISPIVSSFGATCVKLLLLLYGKSETLEPLSALIVSPRAALIF